MSGPNSPQTEGPITPEVVVSWFRDRIKWKVNVPITGEVKKLARIINAQRIYLSHPRDPLIESQGDVDMENLRAVQKAICDLATQVPKVLALYEREALADHR